MPPTTSKQSKKQGAPKAKGGVRAKSGCYTCRIRRKKCDERPNEEGQCETCLRLRLQCLGFGAKRPDWLRENSKVIELREKIKAFLASNGMIKGHSAANSRPNDRDQIILHLSDTDYTSASESSPASQILSLSADDPPSYSRTTTMTSSLRDHHDSWNNGMDYDNHLPSSLLLARPLSRNLYPTTYSRQESPYGGSTGYSDYSYTHHNNSGSLAPWNRSSFGNLYNAHILEEDSAETTTYFLPVDPHFSLGAQLADDPLMEHYMKTVANLQYLLADRSVFNLVIFDGVHTSTFSGDAARLLSSIHRYRLHNPHAPALQTSAERKRYDELEALLNHHPINDDAAMASLHVISSFLFDGGRGEWEKWLHVANQYCESIFIAPTHPYNTRVQTLLYCSERERFLIKTTVWFDVLASVSTLEPPRMLATIREFCSPDVSCISDPDNPVGQQLSMISFMGCENIVVLAIAEISSLAYWKRKQESRGSLSIPELVTRGADIERYLDGSSTSSSMLLLTDLDQERKFTADIFRCSAKVYLRTVISGDYPCVPEIQQGVSETLSHFEALAQAPQSVQNAVIRSTVFALYLCGCLTDDPSHRQTVILQLNSQEGPGNCSAVKAILQEMWSSRHPSHRKDPVNWRQRLKEEKLLLV